MLFNSYLFILLFLPLTFAGFLALAGKSRRRAATWLVAASLFFYGWWNPAYIPLLCLSAAFNFTLGRMIARAPRTTRTRRLLIAAISANLAVLAWFKYATFTVDAVNSLFAASLPLPQVVLPLGISFFTFTQIAFLVDAYRNEASEPDATNYALFVTWFPHLIAGPLLHHRQMMPQFADPATWRYRENDVAAGLTLFAIGLGKKVLLADSVAEYATPVFDGARDGVAPGLAMAWTGALAFTLQIYFDFSGYTDMALGASRLFGVRLPANFDSPYKSSSIIDFWKRWHMTLSAFLRDYLYIPLGGNRLGKARRYLNLMATMLLGGLWHGANWTFLAWGGLHGFYLVVNHAWRARRPAPETGHSRPVVLAGTALTFFAVVVAWVIFRAETFASASSILAGMAGLNGISVPESWRGMLPALTALRYDGPFEGIAALSTAGAFRFMVLAAAGLGIVWGLPNSMQWVDGNSTLRWNATQRQAICAGLLVLTCMVMMSRTSEFLYFQF